MIHECTKFENKASKTYRIPVSTGLIQPQHRQKIGSAIWLFLLLIDWTTDESDGVGQVLGGKPIKIRDIMERLDLQERQVRDQIQRLKAGGYIGLKRTPYGYSITVLKSKKWVFRDRQETADLNEQRPAENCLSLPTDRQETADPDRQETADVNIDKTKETIAGQPKTASRLPAQISKVAVGFKQAMEAYHAAFVSKFGAKPDIDGRDGKLLSGLVKTHGADEVIELLEFFFAHPPEWIARNSKFTIPAFKAAYTELLAKSRNGKSEMRAFG